MIIIRDRSVPGSAHSVGEAELERFERNDIHHVLAAVPGVYIREEDGYGLRPNIGMRGSGSERSAKIALMEDGVLLAPAPYSAPAAYYFPVITRMTRIDVLKGPAAIKYGPNTVGGAVNLISRDVPHRRSGSVDLAGGDDLYGKLHLALGDSTEHFGFLLEGVKLRSDGFKEIDGGGETGFDKNDVQLKLRANSSAYARIYQQATLKIGYSDEVSNETYTGLTTADFAANPYRRYAATRLDRIKWNHLRVAATHSVDFAGDFTLTSTLYRNDFYRSWAKLSGFEAGRSLAEVLADPNSPRNAVLYALLTGARDSESEAETLLYGDNQRDFVSQGAQLVGTSERALGTTRHSLEVGLRLHYDRADRLHTEERYRMMTGVLLPMGEEEVTLDARGSATAFSAYVQDKMRWGRLTLTGGARLEVIGTDWLDRDDPTANASETRSVLIPGGGVHYELTSALGVLAGVHKGFVPVAPGAGAGVVPEESINYEAGARFSRHDLYVEGIGFFNDYSNLKGSCTFSTGCMDAQVGTEYNGGRVNVWGVEFLASTALALSRGLSAPLRLTYTYTDSAFQTGFVSMNPQWGQVEVGDELPYMPTHQVSAEAALTATRWELAVAGRYAGAMRDLAGQGDSDEEARTEDAVVIDVAASYGFGRWGRAYATVDNVFDEAYIASRRPYGARPGIPRLVIVGYKNSF